ncbi:MAG TPA: OmpA family protein [Ignavibacteriaceae bacterium]
MYLTYKIFLMAIFPIVFILPQKDSKLRTHNFSGNTLVSVNGIFTLGYSDYSNGKIGFGAVGMAEYFIPTYSPTIFGLRLLFGGQTVRGKDKFKDPDEFMTDMYILGGGLTLGYTFDNEFFPYVYAGVSNLWISPKDENGKRLPNNSLNAYSRSTIAYDAELGSRIVLQDRLSMFFGVGVHFVQTDNFDDISVGENDDFYYSGRIGVSFTLFSRKDSDGDGIWDSDDACPSNPEDYDGFQDEDGCPDYDNDKDGIPDERDKCPNDPEDFDGFQDDDGCPDLDNDGDGIPDVKDKCPDQPENFNGFEDEDGCPDILDNTQRLLDNDKDGIPNYLDKCPDQAETFNSFQDDDGCPDSVAVSDTISVKEIMLEGIKLFDYRGSEIKSTAYEELDKTAEFLANDPFIKWTVEGYTDNNGVQDSLKLLSLERARTVVRYLINKGLPSFMFKVYGKGSELPITENNTLEGRLKNNRIVIRRLD